jgi:hypothetical protein
MAGYWDVFCWFMLRYKLYFRLKVKSPNLWVISIDGGWSITPDIQTSRPDLNLTVFPTIIWLFTYMMNPFIPYENCHIPSGSRDDKAGRPLAFRKPMILTDFPRSETTTYPLVN